MFGIDVTADHIPSAYIILVALLLNGSVEKSFDISGLLYGYQLLFGCVDILRRDINGTAAENTLSEREGYLLVEYPVQLYLIFLYVQQTDPCVKGRIRQYLSCERYRHTEYALLPGPQYIAVVRFQLFHIHRYYLPRGISGGILRLSVVMSVLDLVKPVHEL